MLCSTENKAALHFFWQQVARAAACLRAGLPSALTSCSSLCCCMCSSPPLLFSPLCPFCPECPGEDALLVIAGHCQTTADGICSHGFGTAPSLLWVSPSPANTRWHKMRCAVPAAHCSMQMGSGRCLRKVCVAVPCHQLASLQDKY